MLQAIQKDPDLRLLASRPASRSAGAPAIHQQIAKRLEALIRTGRLAPGQRLPTHPDLARYVDVHYMTVRQAYRDLQAAGMIEQVRGRGSFVSSVPKNLMHVVVLGPPWEDFLQVPENIYRHHQSIAGMEQYFRDHRVSLRILAIPYPLEKDQLVQWADRIQSEQDGVLCAIGDLDPLISRLVGEGFPAATYYRPAKITGLHASLFDREMATRLATEHLIEQGCQRIGFLDRPAGDEYARDGFEGYFQALVKHELVYDPKLTVRCDSYADLDREKIWVQAVEQAVASGRIGDGIVTGVGKAGVAAVKVLEAHGVRVPQDVAIVGFDDAIDAPRTDPPLSWVYVPAYEIGEVAAEILVERILDPHAEVITRVVEPKLIVGQSSQRRSV